MTLPQSSAEGIVTLLVTTANLAANAVRGNAPEPSEVARGLVDIALALVPVEELRDHLDTAAAARAERLADAAERAKFGEGR